jgi:ribonucleoside-triphosphate reductase
MGAHHGESREAQNLGSKSLAICAAGWTPKQRNRQTTPDCHPGRRPFGPVCQIDAPAPAYEGVPIRSSIQTLSTPSPIPFSALEKIRTKRPITRYHRRAYLYIELDGDPLKNLDAFEQVVR